MTMRSGVAILGIYVSDTAYLAKRMPKIGETLAGSGFSLGPGGKGSNQAVAAAQAGAASSFISKLGRDAFGEMAQKAYAHAGVTPCLTLMDDTPTGAAFIFVNESSGENAIIVYPGAGGTLSASDVEQHRGVIENSEVFVTQLEQPVEAALRGLEIAREAGVVTVFNPAPAESFPNEMYCMCDFIVPNETEAAALVGFEVDTEDDVRKAGDILLGRGVSAALITLGERGAYLHSADVTEHVPAVCSGTVLDTSGAGDAFIGGFTAGLSRGMSSTNAVRYGCVTAGISVTRRGTAPSMPSESEIRVLYEASFGPLEPDRG